MTTADRIFRHHPTVEERAAVGRTARSIVPRSSQRFWEPQPDRADPVDLLVAQNESRVPWLVPLRHARMSVSPFTFYRGTARIMASDLATTAHSGLEVQLGGDAHLSNFGAYASPERQLVFDANDFDETLPGPWEWDLKRLATSFTVACSFLGFDAAATRDVTARVVKTYRTSMAHHAQMGVLDVWYDHLTTTDVRRIKGVDPAALAERLDQFERKAKSRTSLQALRKLAVEEDGHFRIRSDPPVLFPLRELPAEYDAAALEEMVYAGLESYRDTLADDRRVVYDRFTPVDVGVKVVGVGSVGTRCLIVLFEGRDRQDPFFLQIKEAGPSVLEDALGASRYTNHGRRVVEGQRLTQAESDIFLGWTEGGAYDSHFYVRQLRDWKGSIEIVGDPSQLEFYARLCGMTLARGHARTGDPVAISSYIGKSDALDRAITEFGVSYAKQNQADYEAFLDAIADRRLETTELV